MKRFTRAFLITTSFASTVSAQPQEEYMPPPNPPPKASPNEPIPPPPPPVEYVEPPPEQHAPKYSLWTGARLGVIGFGGAFYNNLNGHLETTGDYVKNGLAVEVDIGARLSRRYIPYVGLELGGLPAGHRFDGTGASASSSFVGVGFRYLLGDVDQVSFMTDLSFGFRSVTVQANGQKYTMSALEIFRLGLGAEIRLSTLFTLSPGITLSAGAMNDTSGNIAYAPNQGDGYTGPRYTNGQTIDDQRSYLVVVLGMGAHFDLLGK